jgi:hypothetical protein
MFTNSGANRNRADKMVIPLTDTRFRVAMLMAAFCSAVAAIYAAAGLQPPPLVGLLLLLGPLVCVILWLQQDAYINRVGAVQDVGFFVWLAWPVVIPWYAFRSRGRDGWKLLVTLLAFLNAPQAAEGIVYWLFPISYLN